MSRVAAVSLLLLFAGAAGAQQTQSVEELDRRMAEALGRMSNKAALQKLVRREAVLSQQSVALTGQSRTQLTSLAESLGPDLLNFGSFGELASATAAAALYSYEVPEERIASYTPATDPASLLPATPGEWISPLVSEGRVKSSITYVRTDGRWEFMSAGESPVINDLVAMRQVASRRLLAPEDAFFVVQVLEYTFLGMRTTDRTLYLIPLADDAAMQLRAGTPARADGVFGRIAAAMKNARN